MSRLHDKQEATLTSAQLVELARLVFIENKQDPFNATAAWNRLMQSEIPLVYFMSLVEAPTHTASCDGWCTGREGF